MTDDTTQDTSSDTIRYDIWVEEALRSVIKKALTHVVDHGLSGDHHFYVSFTTQDNGVDIPGHIRAQHPIEMTIVLQHQFDDLTVEDDFFSVSLSFGGKKENLVIPYTSVISFADPSVNFALQLKMMSVDDEDELDGEIMDITDFSEAELETFQIPLPDADTVANKSENEDGDKKTGEVIALDAFRKK
ncbi:MAG: hypothetical protein COB46_11240 [Rhodospirillaceae bacterium]|nr:MAG: hypothetical protein COB46_11240 [Rhodospirillaceae bacterium]